MMSIENPRSPGTEIESGGREGQVPASNAPTNKLLLLLLSGQVAVVAKQAWTQSQLVLFQSYVIFPVYHVGMQWNMLTAELW